jgi:hypothetical protein
MQQRIRDDSANIFASRFYKALASGQPVDVALGEARLSMDRPIKEKTEYNFSDWGIPVLITLARDLNLFSLNRSAPKPAQLAPKGFRKINLPHPGDIFVGRQKEQRLIARALRGGDARCIIILGPGGIGKSSLVARAVEQSEEYFHAVLTIGCKSTPTAEQILFEINNFLMLDGNNMFAQVMQTPLELSKKIEYLPQALNASRYLIIFDNFENMLDVTKEPHVIKDGVVRHLLETLTISLRGSRVMITSRMDFDFTKDRRYQSNILCVMLQELTKMETFRLMENIPSLCNTTDNERLLIYEKVGGNPYILELIASYAKVVPLGNLLAEIENLLAEFVEIKEKAKIAYKQSKSTPTEEIAFVANQIVQKWEISDQKQMPQNIENLIFILKAKISDTPENKHIYNEIDKIRMEGDLAKLIKMVVALIGLIPTAIINIGGNFVIGGYVGGDKIIAIDSSVVSKSTFSNAINNIREAGNTEIAKAIENLAKLIESTNFKDKKETLENIESLAEEAAKTNPKKGTLRVLGESILNALQKVPEIIEKATPLIKIISRLWL